MPLPTEFFLSDRIIQDFVNDTTSGYKSFQPGPGESKGFIIAIEIQADHSIRVSVREAFGRRDPVTGVPTKSAPRSTCPHPPGCKFLTNDNIAVEKTRDYDEDCFI